MSDEVPTDAKLLMDVMGANDVFKKLADSEEFKDILQAVMSLVVPTFDAGWDKETIILSLSSESGTLATRCTMRREKLVKRVNPIILAGINKE